MQFILDFLQSSIGKKLLTASAGILLCVFLVVHLAGNLLLLAGPGTFNGYAAYLEKNPAVPAIEILLAALFLLHIAAAVTVRLQNRAARPQGYQVQRAKGGRTAGSRTMTWTALLLLAFLIIHLKSFRFTEDPLGLYHLVMSSFADKYYAGFYVLAMLALGLHLSHGVQSAFQTFGVNHPRYTPWIKAAGLVFAVAVAGAFAALPVWACVIMGGLK